MDEAHALKNANSQRSRRLRKLAAGREAVALAQSWWQFPALQAADVLAAILCCSTLLMPAMAPDPCADLC